MTSSSREWRAIHPQVCTDSEIIATESPLLSPLSTFSAWKQTLIFPRGGRIFPENTICIPPPFRICLRGRCFFMRSTGWSVFPRVALKCDTKEMNLRRLPPSEGARLPVCSPLLFCLNICSYIVSMALTANKECLRVSGGQFPYASPRGKFPNREVYKKG